MESSITLKEGFRICYYSGNDGPHYEDFVKLSDAVAMLREKVKKGMFDASVGWVKEIGFSQPLMTVINRKGRAVKVK